MAEHIGFGRKSKSGKAIIINGEKADLEKVVYKKYINKKGEEVEGFTLSIFGEEFDDFVAGRKDYFKVVTFTD